MTRKVQCNGCINAQAVRFVFVDDSYTIYSVPLYRLHHLIVTDIDLRLYKEILSDLDIRSVFQFMTPIQKSRLLLVYGLDHFKWVVLTHFRSKCYLTNGKTQEIGMLS